MSSRGIVWRLVYAIALPYVLFQSNHPSQSIKYEGREKIERRECLEREKPIKPKSWGTEGVWQKS